MRIALLAALALGIATGLSPSTAQVMVGGGSIDVSQLMTRADAEATIARIDAALANEYTRAQVDAMVAPIAANASTGAAAAPFARVKWAGEKLSTNASGVWTGSIPAGRMTTGLSVSGIVVRTAGDFAVPRVTATGTPAAGYAISVTFHKLKQEVTVPPVVVGAGATNLSLFETSTGVVQFDIGFAEPDVSGS